MNLKDKSNDKLDALIACKIMGWQPEVRTQNNSLLLVWSDEYAVSGSYYEVCRQLEDLSVAIQPNGGAFYGSNSWRPSRCVRQLGQVFSRLRAVSWNFELNELTCSVSCVHPKLNEPAVLSSPIKPPERLGAELALILFERLYPKESPNG